MRYATVQLLRRRDLAIREFGRWRRRKGGREEAEKKPVGVLSGGSRGRRGVRRRKIVDRKGSAMGGDRARKPCRLAEGGKRRRKRKRGS